MRNLSFALIAASALSIGCGEKNYENECERMVGVSLQCTEQLGAAPMYEEDHCLDEGDDLNKSYYTCIADIYEGANCKKPLQFAVAAAEILNCGFGSLADEFTDDSGI